MLSYGKDSRDVLQVPSPGSDLTVLTTLSHKGRGF